MAFAQFTDNFSDGDFTGNPTWSGEVGKFAVSSGELEVNDVASTGNAYLITSSTASQNAVWEFYHRYEGNPSSSNRAEVYLMSDQSDLTGPLNGYYLRIGEQSGTTDQIELYRQTGSESSEILATAAGTALNSSDEVNIRIRVTRDDLGNWEIFADSEGGTNFVSLGTANDNTHNLSQFFGVNIKYSSTRSEGFFFFDDFSVTGEGVVDSIAPTLLLVDVLSENTLLLEFSEALDPSVASDGDNYTVNNGIGFPSDVQLLSADEVQLTFATNFITNVENELTIFDVSDLAGNISGTLTRNFTFFETSNAIFNDVVVTEIHPAPQDFTAVPNVEFIEIYNRSNKAFQLENWTIQDGSQSGIVEIPAKILTPGAYAVVCNEEFVDLFSGFGEVIGVDGLPSLNNSGDVITLRDASNATIFNIEYSSTWYNDNIKSEGGWSLEVIDVDLPCLGEVNWSASLDPSGGTPGQENSIVGTLGDDQAIQLVDIEVIDAQNIVAVFNEKIDAARLDDITITVDNGIGAIANFTVVTPDLDKIEIELPQAIQENIIYTITVGQIFDCNGNAIGVADNFVFGLPQMVEAGDLLINEILFNPFSGNVDYLELYNVSDKLLSTKDLILAEAEVTEPDVITTFTNLSETRKLIFPNDFIVFTQDPTLVDQAYFVESPSKMLEISSSINYPDDEGVASVFRSDLLLLDQLIYNEDWHNDLIDDENGVSLERISIDAPTQDENNWNSASANAGFGTPTYLNSSTTEIAEGENITITPEIISPNNDGFEDFAIINYQLDKVDYIATIQIFDAKGRPVVRLVNNETVGVQGFYKWDGTNSEGEKVRTGLYIILVDLFDIDGNTKKFKKQIAVALE